LKKKRSWLVSNAELTNKAMVIWKFCRQIWHASQAPAVMGILNVTPDSFSDGGEFVDAERASERAFQLWSQGALWVDVGGESSRPGAQPVKVQEEIARVMPVLEKIFSLRKHNFQAISTGWISIDTMKSPVARAAISAGAVVVNDVSGLSDENGMLELLGETDCGYILTHCQGTPQTMQNNPHYEDCLSEVLAFFESKLKILQRAGVDLERVILDPGFGFGKKWEHNRELLLGIPRIVALGRPVLVGLSRKSFIGLATGAAICDRLAGSLAAETLAVWYGAHIIRTHEPRHTLQAARIARAVFLGEISR
jgi:dihydropteroate synthase